MEKVLYIPLNVIVFMVCFHMPDKSFSQNPPTVWKKQLDYSKNNFGKEDKGDLNALCLVNYTYKGVIKSESEKSSIFDSLLACHAPVVLHLPPLIVRDTLVGGDSCVIYEKRLPKFEIVTIRKMIEIAEMIGEKNPVILLRQQLDKLIEVGFEYLQLEWNYKGKKFYSLCIVSDKNGGVIYEPIGGNIIIGTMKTSRREQRWID